MPLTIDAKDQAKPKSEFLQPHHFAKHPVSLLLALPVARLHGAEARGVWRPQLFRQRTDGPPRAVPVEQAGALKLTHPMFAAGFKQPRQLQRQHAVVKGVIRLRKISFAFNLPHARYRYLRALALGLAIARRQHEARRTIERKPISHDQSYVRINGVWFSGAYVADDVAKRPADWEECAPQKYEEGLRYFDGKR